MKSKNRATAALILIIVLSFVGSLPFVFMMCEDEDNVIVPFLQIPTTYYFFVIVYLIPMIGSIIAGILLPRIIIPFLMKTKGLIWRGFENAYIETGQDPYGLKRWFLRSLYIALLILGLMAAIIGSIDPMIFLTQAQYNEFLAEFGYPQYVPPVTISLAGLLAPLAFGLWAVSWSMEDAGLVHYKIPKEDEKGFFEVEPIHSRYSSYLKGYAGLSSILFLLSIFLILISNWQNALFILLMPLYSMIQTIPGYLVYTRIGKDHLRKGLFKTRHICESDIKADNL